MSWAADNKVQRLLIANRGEIACRIIHTAKKMGLETIAVYSDTDTNAMYVEQADNAYYIGASPANESYLNIERLLAVAEQARADMIHPGYGFLSENGDFARACIKKNIQFIGPPASAINAMGSKSKAKILMAQAGVPLVPGYHDTDQTDQRLIKEAHAIGYPLLIKAASGGGGKGMRVVQSPKELPDAIASARREAASSFGDATLLLEAYLTNTRHVEVQIFFDRHQQSVFLFDRDCSLQRRHQKVIEEAPAPGLSDETREAMGKAAITAGETIAYEGAGTVEFLLSDNAFYFMEVNTRLQVEHPVTEMITGIDLVEWQIRIANGEKLPLKQDQLTCKGHAVEARIYAEDCHNNFLPSAGRLIHLDWPQQNNCVRVDAGVRQGDTVSSWYDPMLAKVIAWGENRNQAVNRLSEALSTTHQAGVIDNRDYLISLLNNADFRNGKISTALTDEHIFSVNNSQPNSSQQQKLLTIAALYRFHCQYHYPPAIQSLVQQNPDINKDASKDTQSHLVDVTLSRLDPLVSSCNFHNSQNSSYPMYFYIGDEQYCIRVSANKGQFSLEFANNTYDARVDWKKEKGSLSGRLYLQKEQFACRVIPLPNSQIKVFLSDCSQVIGLPGWQPENHASTDKSLTAPMNGTVTAVNVIPGQTVDSGCLLLTMEAMKMEYSIKAHKKGVIDSVFFKTGDQVTSGITLLAFEEDADATA